MRKKIFIIILIVILIVIASVLFVAIRNYKIQEQNKSCAYDTMAMYASTHKKKGTSLKELAKSCNTEEFTLESVLNNN